MNNNILKNEKDAQTKIDNKERTINNNLIEPLSSDQKIFNNGPVKEKTTVLLIEYTDGEKYYLDAKTIANLAKTDKYNNIDLNLSEENIDECKLSAYQFPDFSSLLPFNKKYGLYEVSEEQIKTLVSNIEQRNPDLFVEINLREFARELENEVVRVK